MNDGYLLDAWRVSHPKPVFWVSLSQVTTDAHQVNNALAYRCLSFSALNSIIASAACFAASKGQDATNSRSARCLSRRAWPTLRGVSSKGRYVFFNDSMGIPACPSELEIDECFPQHLELELEMHTSWH
mmetsp:Transcript_16639/g.50160  ORF Transcript_16639/g.50160 Transcript_16639/m.50160 type:complete len:129 (+) Transcript_16639:1684-2070(+)